MARARPCVALAAFLLPFGEAAPVFAQTAGMLLSPAGMSGPAPVPLIRTGVSGSPAGVQAPLSSAAGPGLSALGLPPAFQARTHAAVAAAKAASAPNAAPILSAAARARASSAKEVPALLGDERPHSETLSPSPARDSGSSVESRREGAAGVAALQRTADEDASALRERTGASLRSGAAADFDRLLGIRTQARRPDIGEAARPAGRSSLPGPRNGLLPPDNLPSTPSSEVEPPALPTAPPSASRAATLRRYLAGTAIFKVGMEALGLAVPLLALTVFGQVKWAAMMAVGWGLSQAVFGSLAGSLLDKRDPVSVLSGAMRLQAAAGGGLLALYGLDLLLPALLPFAAFNPVTVFLLYSLAGGALGMADVARQVIPPHIIGGDEKAIKLFNARTHIAYEVAGVAGALLAGWAISAFGLGAALLLHPPAYLLAAWVFSRIKLGEARPAPATGAGEDAPRPDKGWKRAWEDLKEGAGAVLSHRAFRWGMLALVLPMVLHRLLESLLIPVAAQTFLADPAKAAWIIGASNFGELLGAVFLARSIQSDKNPRTAFWVKLMALGLLGLWSLFLGQGLALLLPLVAFSSLSWAASDLSLRGKLQAALPESVRGRSFAFISAAGFLSVLVLSLGVGFLMDLAARSAVFLAVGAAVTAMAVLMWQASKILSAPK